MAGNKGQAARGKPAGKTAPKGKKSYLLRWWKYWINLFFHLVTKKVIKKSPKPAVQKKAEPAAQKKAEPVQAPAQSSPAVQAQKKVSKPAAPKANNKKPVGKAAQKKWIGWNNDFYFI